MPTLVERTHHELFGQGVYRIPNRRLTRRVAVERNRFLTSLVLSAPAIEPVRVRNRSSQLAFTVSEQPEPLREWSPYDIHPPHVHGFMEGKEGHLMLESLPNGDTK